MWSSSPGPDQVHPERCYGIVCCVLRDLNTLSIVPLGFSVTPQFKPTLSAVLPDQPAYDIIGSLCATLCPSAGCHPRLESEGEPHVSSARSKLIQLVIVNLDAYDLCSRLHTTPYSGFSRWVLSLLETTPSSNIPTTLVVFLYVLHRPPWNPFTTTPAWVQAPHAYAWAPSAANPADRPSRRRDIRRRVALFRPIPR